MNFDDLSRERERVLSEATTDILITSLLIILAEWEDADMSDNARLVHAWTCEELEKRVPAIVPIVLDLIESSPEMRYGQMIIFALGEVEEN
jgi:hypothetical protein